MERFPYKNFLEDLSVQMIGLYLEDYKVTVSKRPYNHTFRFMFNIARMRASYLTYTPTLAKTLKTNGIRCDLIKTTFLSFLRTLVYCEFQLSFNM